MAPVAFLCANCKKPLWVDEAARGTPASCAGCGVSCMVPSDAPALAEAPQADSQGDAAPSALVDLATLPVIGQGSEKTLENKGFPTDLPQEESGLKPASGTVFPWLLLWMTASFSILSAILAIYLVLRLRAADEALRKRADSSAIFSPIMTEQKRGRIKDLAFGS